MTTQVRTHRRIRGVIARLALLGLLITTECAVQSEMTDLWKDPSFKAGSMQDVLVVALRKEPVRRRMWEDAFARELGARGMNVTSSYQLFPGAPPDTQEVIAAIRRDGYDAVVVSIRLPNETTSTFVPGVVRREMVTTRDYFGAFHQYWTDVQEPGHTETDEILRVQTDVWSTGDGGRLIWSGTLRTLESLSNRTVESAVAKDIVPMMEKQGMVPKRK